MKREFLQNLKVCDQALPKEVIDSIMQENGRDIEAEKQKYSDYDTMKSQLTEAQKALKDIKDSGGTIEAAQAKASEWENKYNQAIADHQKAMAERDFSDRMEKAITGAHGKNSKAIMALLDLPSLRESKNQEADIKSAIEACQKENDYLFDDGETPPPYAGGAGSGGAGGKMDGVEAAFRNLNPGLKI